MSCQRDRVAAEADLAGSTDLCHGPNFGQILTEMLVIYRWDPDRTPIAAAIDRNRGRVGRHR